MKYTFPKVEKTKGEDLSIACDSSWMRRLELPTDSLKGLEIGEAVTITIKARVTGLELREREGEDARNEITLDMASYTIDGKNEFAELAEDD